MRASVADLQRLSRSPVAPIAHALSTIAIPLPRWAIASWKAERRKAWSPALPHHSMARSARSHGPRHERLHKRSERIWRAVPEPSVAILSGRAKLIPLWMTILATITSPSTTS